MKEKKKRKKREKDEIGEKQLEDVAGGIIEVDYAAKVPKKTTEPLDKPRVTGSGGEDR